MDRTNPHAGFPFPKRKTKHRFVLWVALSKTAGGALAELGQRLVSVAMVRVSNCLKIVKTEKRHHDARMTSALTPALSPRRGRIVRRSFENLYDWIGRLSVKPETIESYFLSWGRG
jgi:hypothetical protein